MTTSWWKALCAALVMVAAPQALASDGTQDRTRDRDQTRDPTTHAATSTTPDQDRLRTRDRLRDVLRTDGELSSSEVASVDDALAGYAQRGGDEEHFRAMVRSSVGDGCRGVCLCEAVRGMNQLMERGQSAERARATLNQMTREQRQQREQKHLALSDQQNQERLRERVREHERAMDQERERAHEQKREAAREQTRQGAGAGGQGGAQGGPGGGGARRW